MIAILSLLLILVLSMLVTRVGTMALIHTGLSRDVARFQARSAFSGVGFTTSEAEMVVHHPVRRRIILILMRLGNAGIVTLIASLILGFVGEHTTSVWARLLVLGGGVAILWLLASTALVDRWLSRLISWVLDRWTDIDVRDYASLLHLTGKYSVRELAVEENDWVAGKTLREAGLREEGVTVLGIERADGSFVGAPHGSTQIEPGDRLILYGRSAPIDQIDRRVAGAAGEREHEAAVKEQDTVVREERAEEMRRGHA